MSMSPFNNSLNSENWDYVLEELNWAAKFNLAFGFVQENFWDGSCGYFKAHENNTVSEKSIFVCTAVELNYLIKSLQKIDFNET